MDCILGLVGGLRQETVALLITAIILALTLRYVVGYAKAARRQAEIMKDEFDVQYTPHLRPAVRRPDMESKSVIVRLRNLAGAAAIHPGFYPEWTKPHKRNAELVREPDDGSEPCLPQADFFTLPVMKVGLTGWLCCVPMPPAGSGKAEVAWGEEPWGKRDRYIWSLEPISEGEEEKGWHFVYHAEDNEPSSSS